jgi:hypothetical protein
LPGLKPNRFAIYFRLLARPETKSLRDLFQAPVRGLKPNRCAIYFRPLARPETKSLRDLFQAIIPPARQGT